MSRYTCPECHRLVPTWRPDDEHAFTVPDRLFFHFRGKGTPCPGSRQNVPLRAPEMPGEAS